MTAEVKDRPTYDEDFYAWTRDQAKHLRAQARLRKNEPIDWPLLAEEVENLGNEQRRAVASHLERLIQYLLKLEFAKDQTPRRQWLLSIDGARAEIDRRWTATIACDITPALEKAHARGRRAAALELEDHGESETARDLPEGLHYTLEQLLDEDWYPAAADRD